MTQVADENLRSDLCTIIWDGQHDGDLVGDMADQIIKRFDDVIRTAVNAALEQAADITTTKEAGAVRILKYHDSI